MSIIEHIISLIAPPECVGCAGEGAYLCRRCRANLPAGQELTDIISGNVFAASGYEGAAKRLVYLLKFERNQSAVADIGSIIAASLPSGYRPDAVTYVPTATSRVRRRGYDHAKLIAASVARNIGAPCLPLLIRLGQKRQVGQSKSFRAKQTKGAFRAAASCQGKRILLIDDVLTTGSTLREASTVLLRSGAERVDGAVFALAAKKLKRQSGEP